jgi:hypothetical protein
MEQWWNRLTPVNQISHTETFWNINIYRIMYSRPRVSGSKPITAVLTHLSGLLCCYESALSKRPQRYDVTCQKTWLFGHNLCHVSDGQTDWQTERVILLVNKQDKESVYQCRRLGTFISHVRISTAFASTPTDVICK